MNKKDVYYRLQFAGTSYSSAVYRLKNNEPTDTNDTNHRTTSMDSSFLLNEDPPTLSDYHFHIYVR